MFTIVNYRRKVAVLTALALVASVLVAAPVSAADPAPDYGATFDACADAPSSDFTDVSSNHANAGDIDCIAYYGVTKGTSATTYSPMMSVSREHMALFLIRLAGLVGIEVASDPADPGYSDIGDLSAGSQTAIAQLADLGITTGTSDTTYSPGDSVERGHMALFIARLMNLMDPMSDGDDSDGDFGYTPSDVVDNDRDKDIGSPFTDLGTATKSAYDAITELYELGVASGISDTAYGPSTLITRASMAEFMAGVLDHSNARPAGLTIQASKTSGFGEVSAAVVVSVRDDSFAAVADQAVDIFSSEADNGGLTRDGNCADTGVVGDCTWHSNDEFTDGDGNIIDDTAGATEDETNMYYAWIGDEDDQDFDADGADEVTVSIASSSAEAGLKVTSTINDNADADKVNLNKISSVAFTVQLVDNATVADGKNVARSGIKIMVGVTRTGDEENSNTNAATLTTDEDGKATYTVDRPTPDKDEDAQARNDVLTFDYASADDTEITDIAQATGVVDWIEAASVTTSVKASANNYVIVEADGDATVRATVTLYDQYGNGFREGSGQQVEITIGTGDGNEGSANVNRNGVGSRSRKLEGQTAGEPVTVTVDADPTEDPDVDIAASLDNPPVPSVQVVTNANPDDDDAREIHTFYADDNEFTTEETGAGSDADKLYSYDSDDTFTSGGSVITMAKFEELLAQPDDANMAAIEVLIYDPEGSSIFKVVENAAGEAQ